MKRVSLFLLIFVFMFSVFLVGCASNSADGDNQTEDENGNGESEGGDSASSEGNKPAYWSSEPASVQLMAYKHSSWPFNPDWPIIDWHKENTNITVEEYEYAGEYADAIALTVSGGETPDIIQFLGPEDAMKYGQMGALVDLSEHLDQMPNFKAYLEEHPTAQAVGTSPEGALYYAVTEGMGALSVRNWMYRQDVFEKHNLEAPTNWEELYEVSKELKGHYPESYPFTFRSNFSNLEVIAPSFNVWGNYYPDPETGEVKYGPVEDNYKEMVTWLNKFYSEGLMAPDWLSLTTKGWAEYHTTDKAFITVDYVLRIPYLNERLTDDGQYTQMAPALGHPDGGILNGDVPVIGLAVFTTAPNKEASFKYLDYLFSEEGQLSASWGKEDVTYTVEGGEKGWKEDAFKDGVISFDALRVQYGAGTNGMYGWFDSSAALATYADEERRYYEDATQWTWDEEPIIQPNFTEAEQETVSTVGANIQKHFEEQIAKFIMGERSLDEWDDYVAEIEDLGLQEMIDLMQEGWDRVQ